jgi:hypothetical protein
LIYRAHSVQVDEWGLGRELSDADDVLAGAGYGVVGEAFVEDVGEGAAA